MPLYFVSKLAKDNGVTVVHVGEGADELFAGYPTYVAGATASPPRHWPRLRSLPRAGAPRLLAAAGAAALRLRPDREIHVEALRRAAQPDGQLWWGGAVAFYEHGLGAHHDAGRCARELDGAAPARRGRRRSPPTPTASARATSSTG